MPQPERDTAKMKRQLAVQSAVLTKHRAVVALHVTAYTSKVPLEKIAQDFFFALGELLEGVDPLEIHLGAIDRDAFLKELDDT